MHSTWFLFDKSGFPMMQEFQNVLFVNDVDPTNATIFDRKWIVQFTSSLGLTVRSVTPPTLRGFHWILQFTPARPGVTAVQLPEDNAPVGRRPPPIGRANASMLGIEDLG